MNALEHIVKYFSTAQPNGYALFHAMFHNEREPLAIERYYQNEQTHFLIHVRVGSKIETLKMYYNHIEYPKKIIMIQSSPTNSFIHLMSNYKTQFLDDANSNVSIMGVEGKDYNFNAFDESALFQASTVCDINVDFITKSMLTMQNISDSISSAVTLQGNKDVIDELCNLKIDSIMRLAS